MTMLWKKSVAVDVVIFFADSTDGKTGKTGLSPTITISKAGGAFAAISGSVSEISSGNYKVALNTTDTNTNGSISLHGTGTGADNVDAPNIVQIVEFDPFDAAALGLSRIDAAVTTRLAPTTAGRTLDVAATGEAGLDFDNVKVASAPTILTNITVPTVMLVGTLTTYTGNTPQTGDAYARLGAPIGASVSADIKRALGLMHENSTDDLHVYSSSKLTSCRKRVFASKAAALAATPGAADNADGEIARYLLTFSYTGDDLTGASWVRDL